MDAERPIEKMLRTTARKRAEDAGERLSPHPATRRLLQAEVTRVYGRHRTAAKPPDPAWSLSRLWPSLGWSFALLIGLGLAAALMLPQRRSGNYEMAMAPKPAPLGEASAKVVVPDVARTESVSDEARADRDRPVSRQPGSEPLLAYDAAGQKDTHQKSKLESLDAVAVNNGLLREAKEPSVAGVPASPAFAGRGAGTPSKTEADHESLAGQAANSTATASTLTLAAAPPASSAVSRAPESQRKELPLSGGTETRRSRAQFVQAPAVGGALLDKATAPILATFQLEQTGSQVRIVDVDGSVYSGQLKPSVLNEKSASGVNVTPNGNRVFRFLAAEGTETNHELAGAFSFQVEGTNQTLKQKVFLTGELYTARDTESKNAITNASAAAAAVAKNKPFDATGSGAPRISAKAVIGTAVYEIRAVSAP